MGIGVDTIEFFSFWAVRHSSLTVALRRTFNRPLGIALYSDSWNNIVENLVSNSRDLKTLEQDSDAIILMVFVSPINWKTTVRLIQLSRSLTLFSISSNMPRIAGLRELLSRSSLAALDSFYCKISRY